MAKASTGKSSTVSKLLGLAIEESKKRAIQPRPKRPNWLDVADLKHPDEAHALREIFDQWISDPHSEIKIAHPSKTSLARWVSSLDFIDAAPRTICEYLSGRGG